MKRKSIFASLLVIGCLVFLQLQVKAQGNSNNAPGRSENPPGNSGDAPGHNKDAPFDGGLIFTIVAGAAYGLKKAHSRRKKDRELIASKQP
jgi:hypothetical protein